MKCIVSFHFLAEQELNDTANYYNIESAELGKAFLREIDRIIKFIVEYPEAAPLVNRTVRRKLVKKFPYAVLYSVRDDRVRNFGDHESEAPSLLLDWSNMIAAKKK